MPTFFETRDRDGAGRLGRFRTDHGVVETPHLLPVLNPNRPLIAPREMRGMGAGMLITNSYIIRKTPHLRERALEEGVHKLIDWDGPVMTDSGTFQMYMYGEVEVTNPEIVSFQRDIGVDVGTILDIFSTPDRTHEQASADVAETLKRAEEAAALAGGIALAGTVQGGVYPDLRRSMAESYRDLAMDFHPIGGVVPLMEQQRYVDLVRVIIGAKEGLDASRPVHLFGAGHPLVFPIAAYLGCDFFDSASYAKYAQADRVILSDGTAHLADMEDFGCACPVCAAWTPAELLKASKAERLRALGEHNLRISLAEVRRVRDAIRRGRLADLCEARSRAHPSLEEAWRVALAHEDYLEAREPLSKRSAYFHTGPTSMERPEAVRTRRRLLHRWRPGGKAAVLLPPARRPFSHAYQVEFVASVAAGFDPVVRTVFGAVPLSLDEAWPFAQSVEADHLDAASGRLADSYLHAFLEHHHLDSVVPDALEAPGREVSDAELDRPRVAAVLDYEFGAGASEAILRGDVRIRKSRRTGKIRTVHSEGEHVLSLRAEDGLFTLKWAGAKRLHAAFPRPRLRVVVDSETAAFNRDGRNVFSKFVRSVDSDLRAGDECLIVDEADELCAVAQLLLPAVEVPDFRSGVAAAVREGVNKVERDEGDEV